MFKAALLISVLVAHASYAQTNRAVLPSDSKIEKEIQRINIERKAMFDLDNSATQNIKNNFPNIATPAVSTVDIQTIAKRYEQRAKPGKTDELMIFVSFIMPTESLKHIVSQARKIGASVVLNGFKDNSLKATTEAIKQLGTASGNVLINPNAFIQYEVKAIPTFVLAKPDSLNQLDQDGCAASGTYVSIAGDVSLDYALDAITKRSTQFAALASRYNRQLKGH
jgi:conjugal transfer pilus assembly protein TrbC